MRNIRMLVEFASVVMPGAVFLVMFTLLFGRRDFLTGGFLNSAFGIMAGLAMAFAVGHLLQGFAQLVIEPIWVNLEGGWSTHWAATRFANRESERYLTDGQIQQLELQYPVKLGIPFPSVDDAADRTYVECAVMQAEAFLYSAKVTERLEDIAADYKLNKGLFTAFLLILPATAIAATGVLAVNASAQHWSVPAGVAVGLVCSYARMRYHNRKYAQTIYLQFLTTAAGREGGGKGGDGGGGAGGMGIGGIGRGASPARGAQPVADEES